MTSTTKLDRSKPFGVVYGHPVFHYAQGGKHFNAKEELVGNDAEPSNPVEADGLEELHWTKLRKMVEEKGGEWSNKDDAIIYLRGKEVG